MEEVDKGWLMSRKGLSGWNFSSGIGLPGYSQIKGHKTVMCGCAYIRVGENCSYLLALEFFRIV